jgi:outer membrane receptor protein involved in Fe transport
MHRHVQLDLDRSSKNRRAAVQLEGRPPVLERTPYSALRLRRHRIPLSAALPTDDANQYLRGQNILAAWTHIFNGRLINEARTGFTRFSQNEIQGRAGKTDVAAELGMRGLCSDPSCWGIPQMVVTAFAQFGEHGGQAVSGPRGWRNEAFQWSDSVYFTTGAHSLKAGMVVRRHRDNFPEAIDPRGQYTFNGFLTGQPLGDYLLGYPRNTLTSIDIFSPHLRNTAVEPWIQDDWRVSSDLTLNLGLRYEWSGRPVSKNGTISSVVFDSKGPRLITGQNPDGYPRPSPTTITRTLPRGSGCLFAEAAGRKNRGSGGVRDFLSTRKRQHMGGLGDQRSVHPSNQHQSGHDTH